MRSLVVALLVAMVAVSGCFGDDDEPETHEHHEEHDPCADTMDAMDHGDDDAMESGNESGALALRSVLPLRQEQGNETGNTTGNETMDAGNDTAEPDVRYDENGCPFPNTPPVSGFQADVTNGTVPFDVVFTFNGTDDNGDNLTWTLDVDGDGVADSEGNQNNLPGNFTYTFTTAGQYVSEFVLNDGSAEHVAKVLITAADPPSEDPGDLGNETVEEEPEFEDRGTHLYEFATGHCHLKSYTTYPPAGPAVAYGHDFWVFAESNGVEGLQVAPNHPTHGSGAGFEYPAEEDCEDGDLILV